MIPTASISTHIKLLGLHRQIHAIGQEPAVLERSTPPMKKEYAQAMCHPNPLYHSIGITKNFGFCNDWCYQTERIIEFGYC